MKCKKFSSAKPFGIKLPNKGSISGRCGTISSEFIRALIPEKRATEELYEEALRILGHENVYDIECSYCGSKRRLIWDHFYSVMNGAGGHTGFITEVYNLVPCCSACNSQKGNKNWRNWMMDSKSIPMAELGSNMFIFEQKLKRLEAFEKWGLDKRTEVSLEKDLGEDYINYLKTRDELMLALKKCQKTAKMLKARVLY